MDHDHHSAIIISRLVNNSFFFLKFLNGPESIRTPSYGPLLNFAPKVNGNRQSFVLFTFPSTFNQHKFISIDI